MKIEETEVDAFVTVKKGTRTIKKFIARDGRDFTTEKDCIEWEKIIDYNEKLSKIKTITYVFNIYPCDIPERWFFPPMRNN